MTRLAAALALAALTAAAPGALADGARVGDLVVENAWARATPVPGRPGAAYLTVRNTGTAPDRLIAAESPRAGRAELHETRMEGDVMRMGRAGPLPVPPGGTLKLEPGGYHVMLMELARPLREGATVPIILTFERAGRATVDVPVRAPGATGPHGR